MKAVMISIRPEWCEKIASGEKTVEVRKTRPEIDPPFKCYIYCTKAKEKLWVSKGSERAFTREKIAAICQAKDVGGAYQGNGKVIGEFVCNRIRRETEVALGLVDVVLEKTSCMDYRQIMDYADGKTVYGWNISELVIYDQPKELSEFRSYEAKTYICEKGFLMPTHEITRPPQSWCYVEEVTT